MLSAACLPTSETDAHRSAYANRARDLNASTMSIHDPFREREPEPCSPRELRAPTLTTKERFEHVRKIAAVDAEALVYHIDEHDLAGCSQHPKGDRRRTV